MSKQVAVQERVTSYTFDRTKQYTAVVKCAADDNHDGFYIEAQGPDRRTERAAQGDVAKLRRSVCAAAAQFGYEVENV